MNCTRNENISLHQRVTFKDGPRNYIYTLFLILVFSIIVDNYVKYGIIYTPYQLVIFFLNFMNQTRWVYVIVCVGIVLQLVTSILVENLLLKRMISERTGMILHAFNSLLVLNIITIISTFCKYSCSAGCYLMSANFLFVFKFWSFACVNREFRSKYLQEKNTKRTGQVEYPDNLTFSHLAKFVIGSPRLVYLPDEMKPSVLSVKNVVKHLVGMIVLTLVAVFVVYQYVLPEMVKIVWLIESSNLLVALVHLPNFMVPVLTAYMLMAHSMAFYFYLPLLAEVMGVRLDVVVMADWWNAKDSSQYWTMWNVQASLFFKKHIMQPILKRGYSNFQAVTATFLVSGLLHEYLFSAPMRSGYGQAVFTFLLQVPLRTLTKRIKITFGDTAGNIACTIQVLLMITMVPFAAYYHYIIHEYGSIKNCEFSKLIT